MPGTVRGGSVLHRDLFLTDDERRDSMMPASRAAPAGWSWTCERAGVGTGSGCVLSVPVYSRLLPVQHKHRARTCSGENRDRALG